MENFTGIFSADRVTIVHYDHTAPEFDAATDVIDWFGQVWQELAEALATVHNQDVFTFHLARAGVRGYPVRAVYNHIHGAGAWID